MSDEYQRGTDIAWIQHSNEELGRLLKRKHRQLSRVRSIGALLVLVLAWVVFKYSKVAPLEGLWRW